MTLYFIEPLQTPLLRSGWIALRSDLHRRRCADGFKSFLGRGPDALEGPDGKCSQCVLFGCLKELRNLGNTEMTRGNTMETPPTVHSVVSGSITRKRGPSFAEGQPTLVSMKHNTSRDTPGTRHASACAGGQHGSASIGSKNEPKLWAVDLEFQHDPFLSQPQPRPFSLEYGSNQQQAEVPTASAITLENTSKSRPAAPSSRVFLFPNLVGAVLGGHSGPLRRRL